MTQGQFVNDIQGSLRLDSKDTYVSKRHILSVAKTYLKTYVSQRLDAFKIDKTSDLVKTLKCHELEPLDTIKCGIVEIVNCTDVMVSKEELPELINGRIVPGILEVTSIDGETIFHYTTRSEFKYKKSGKYSRKNRHYYTVENNRIVLLDSKVEAVDVRLLSLDEILGGCDDCNKDGDCTSMWDREFNVSDKLRMYIRQVVMQDFSTPAQVPKDENPNLNSNMK